MEEYNSNNGLIAAYNYYYESNNISGVRKIESNKTTEFQGNFVRPIYENDNVLRKETWWIYGIVCYRNGFSWRLLSNAVVKHDKVSNTWYLYRLTNLKQPIMSQKNIEFSLYAKINGKLIKYPNLPSNLPFDMKWAEPINLQAGFSEPLAHNSAVIFNAEMDNKFSVEEDKNNQLKSGSNYTYSGQLASSPSLLKHKSGQKN